MKKVIASIALGTFLFASTFVTSSFAAEKEAVNNVKAPATTAENTAISSGNSAAAAAISGMAVVGIIAGAAIISAAVIASDDNDAPVGHGH